MLSISIGQRHPLPCAPTFLPRAASELDARLPNRSERFDLFDDFAKSLRHPRGLHCGAPAETCVRVCMPDTTA